MGKLTCYYAHTMISYGSTIEAQDIRTLEELGFKVLNPNSDSVTEGLEKFLKLHDRSETMEYFKQLVASCDLVAFRSLPDGTILSGVAAEVQHAVSINYPVIELPCSINKRSQEYPETKQYLTEVGFYKTFN